VKSNLGHTQAAAGVAGVIKMVLALQHQALPRSLHIAEPSPQVDWSAGAVRLLTETVPWPADRRPRLAGVSSFGISGTNAHLVLEEASPSAGRHLPGGAAQPETAAPAGPAAPPVLTAGPVTWLVSGRTATGLLAQAEQLRAYLAACPGLDPVDVGFSLATTRSVLRHRAVVSGASAAELTAGLGAVAAGRPAAGVVTGVAGETGRVVFVFPGQGSQWAGMGRELAVASPVFAARLAECGRALARYVDWDLAEVIGEAAGAPGLAAAEVVQPVLWAVMVALAAVWQAAGVRPDAVVGHSQGEIAAATVAGMLSLEDAAQVVAVRSRALSRLGLGGGMLSVVRPAAQVRELLSRWGDRLSIAAVNGPAATVVSGELQALAELEAELSARHVLRWPIPPTDFVAHSSLVQELAGEITEGLASVRPSAGQVPLYSTVHCRWMDGPELDAGYWYANLRQTVRFADAVKELAVAGHRSFIEISPHPVLTTAIEDTVEASGAAGVPLVTGTLHRDDGGAGRLLTSLAQAHAHGAAVDWAAVLAAGHQVGLPTYAFQRQRYWPERPAARTGDLLSAGLNPAGHPLLSAAVPVAGSGGLLFTGQLSLRTHPWLADHTVAGVAVLPGTALLELAVLAGYKAGSGRVAELILEAPLVMPEDAAIRIQVTVGGPDETGDRTVEMYSRPAAAEEPWTLHASGLLSPARPPAAGPGPDELAAWPPDGAVPVPAEGLYEELAAGGHGYGPAFRGLRAAWRRGGDVFAEVALPGDAAADAGAFVLHPALLDAALHVMARTAAAGTEGRPGSRAGQIQIPFAWRDVTLYAAGASVLRARLCQSASGELSLTAADAAGAPVVSVGSLALRPVSPGQLEAARGGLRDAVYSVDWVALPVPVAAGPAGRWALVGDDRLDLLASLAEARADVRAYPDLATLIAAVAAGDLVPELVLACAMPLAGADAGAGGSGAVPARAATGHALGLVQEWLAEEGLPSSRLVLVTAGAVAAGPGDGPADPAGPAVWGLVRSAQWENPGRVVLADLPGGTPAAGRMLAAALSSGEPELAVRDETVYGRRLARPGGGLTRPDGAGPWRLEATGPGRPDGLALAACPQAAAPLAPGQVRIAVRAGGLSRRDLLTAQGAQPGGGALGGEVAGLVTETASDVAGLAVGDRVLGLAAGGLGPLAVADARLLAPIPAGWSFAQAASVPVAFTTAWHALAGLASARAGQRLLVHGAAEGTGLAAVAVARHLGLEVYGTAHPGQHGALAAAGLDAAHVASSQTAGFAELFLAATGGAGMDVVLMTSPSGEHADAARRLLTQGGAFIEPDMSTAEPGRLGEILAQVVGLLADGKLEPLPIRAWDVRRAPEALGFIGQAQLAGRVVLTIPPDPAAPRAAGTALVTGGTGTLGGMVAGHLTDAGRASTLILASRSGPAAPGAAALAASLAAQGAGVRVTACDSADRDALAGLLALIPAAEPLTMVVHAAGIIDDGAIASQTPARVDAVMRPKSDAAWHLHELTAGLDLEAFVLFSSAAATFGGAGQANYAAANAFLDGLAAARQAAGLPAHSLAWGIWAAASGMTGHLSQTERARIARGMTALASGEGLDLLDLALARDEAHLVLARLEMAALRAVAQAGALPPFFSGLVGPAGLPARRAATAAAPADQGAALRDRLSGAGEHEQERLLTDLVRAETAAVLGHPSPEAVGAGDGFLELGLNSLSAVELRNRLTGMTGLRLPGTAVFDHPTPSLLARQLRADLSAAGMAASPDGPRPDAAGHRYTAAREEPPAADAVPAGFLSELYLQAARADRTGQIMGLIQGLAAFRQGFAGPAGLGSVPRPVSLCRGPASPSVICFPSFVGRSQEYARFAGSLRGVRDVSLVPSPGYAAGEPLPATAGALVEVHAENIRRCADGTPFVLAGHSSGGLIAHAVATRLQRCGLPPAAVVLLDTSRLEAGAATEKSWSMLPGIVLTEDQQQGNAREDAWLTAMAHYFSLDWADLDHTALPTLLVRPEEPLAGSAAWTFSSNITLADVPGNHFSMMTDHAGPTARAVDDWLARL
jgi:acyl transferase domain-containing protein/NADPH:quinone reductase-like Zn-dependent oxidoreductase/thioesterase domain-containing protein